MIERDENGVRLLQFPKLIQFPELKHAVFTRNGGYSPRPFQSLNVGMSVEDDPVTVEENRGIVSECFDGKDLVFLRQVHGKHVHLYAGSEGASEGVVPLEADAIVTDVRNKMLVIQVADCQAILLYDPVKRVIANVHSGWRGSILNILGETIGTMVLRFSSVPENIIAGISPSLGPCCADFINYRWEIPSRFWKYKDDADLFDFWTISQDQLCGAGVRTENVHISRICTRCNTYRFFSYRGEGRTGRFATLIGLA